MLKVKPKINVSAEDNQAFRYACSNGHLEVAKWLLTVKSDVNISEYNEHAFRSACHSGHQEIAKWLLSVKPDINISANDEHAFRSACHNGHQEIAKWLLTLKPDINVNAKNDEAFLYACSKNKLQLALWLQSICVERYVIFINDDNKITHFEIINTINIKNIAHKTNLEICPICIESVEEIQTVDCKHGFCIKCINKWINTFHNTCPCCRASLNGGFNKYTS